MIPIGSKILVKPAAVKTEVKTESGLVLVAPVETYKAGTILAVSEDLVDVRLMKGDEILYEAGAGIPVEGGLLMDFRSAVAITKLAKRIAT